METMEIIILSLGSILSMGMGYLIMQASKFLKLKLREGREILPIQGNPLVDGLFDFATDAVSTVAAATVAKLEQTTGKELRQLVKEGKADREELLGLAEDAYQEIMETISFEVLDDLENYVQDSELYIRNVIEKELLKLKSELGA